MIEREKKTGAKDKEKNKRWTDVWGGAGEGGGGRGRKGGRGRSE